MKSKLSILLFTLICIVIFSTCDKRTNLVGETRSLQSNKAELQSNKTEVEAKKTSISSSYPEIDGDWVRVGSSGTGIDIVARNKIYIIGENHKIYYYDSVQDDWIQEPGGGEGKKISMIGNHTLIIRGHNNHVYRKPVGSSSPWEILLGTIDLEVNDISGPKNSGFDNNKINVTGLNGIAYSWKGNWFRHPSSNTEGLDIYAEQIITGPDNLTLAITGEEIVFPYEDDNYIYYKGNQTEEEPVVSNDWQQQLFDEQAAIDLAFSSNGTWFIGENNRIYFLDGGVKIVSTGTGKRISVSHNDTVYIIGTNNKIYRFIEF